MNGAVDRSGALRLAGVMHPTFPILVGLVAFAAAPALAGSPIFPTEPVLGTMRIGQRVLVDDGLCKAGELREVVVNSRKSGDTARYPDGGPRVRRCVKR